MDTEKNISNNLVEQMGDALDQRSPQYFGLFTAKDIADMFEVDTKDVFEKPDKVKEGIRARYNPVAEVWQVKSNSPAPLFEMMVLVPDNENMMEFLRNKLYNIYMKLKEYDWDITAHHWKNKFWR